jgi:hypothetical protein
VGAVLVVMAAVDAQHVLEMSATEDENPIETVGAERPDPAFGIGVRVRGLDWCPDHLDALGVKDLVERVAELLVAIVDQESERVVVTELHDEVARLLHDPGPSGSETLSVSADSVYQLDPPRTRFRPSTRG